MRGVQVGAKQERIGFQVSECGDLRLAPVAVGDSRMQRHQADRPVPADHGFESMPRRV
jgi:hypothetical protein